MVVYWFFFKPLSHLLKNITLLKLGRDFLRGGHEEDIGGSFATKRFYSKY